MIQIFGPPVSSTSDTLSYSGENASEDGFRWGYTLRLDFEDGSQLLADGQIAGSVDLTDEGWEWGWNNPNVEEAVAKDSELVRELGEKFDVECLRSGITQTSGGPFPAFLAAVSVKATNSIGAYPAVSGDIMAFILLKNLKWFNPETN